MLNKAGLISYYGPSIMSEFESIKKCLTIQKKQLKIFYLKHKRCEVKSSKYWSNDYISGLKII